jgi:hypothetical protein
MYSFLNYVRKNVGSFNSPEKLHECLEKLELLSNKGLEKQCTSFLCFIV